MKDADCYKMRENLFAECLEKFKTNGNLPNELSDLADDAGDIKLCKRYKINLCYEDIYTIGLSYAESTPHKDLLKLIAPKKKTRKSTAPPSAVQKKQQTVGEQNVSPYPPSTLSSDRITAGTATTTQSAALSSIAEIQAPPAIVSSSLQTLGASTPQTVVVSSIEAAPTAAVHQSTGQNNTNKILSQDVITKLLDNFVEIKQSLTAVRKENKDLKESIGLMCTKVDKQHKEYSALKKEHEQLKSKVKGMTAGKGNTQTISNLVNEMNAAANDAAAKSQTAAPGTLLGAAAANFSPNIIGSHVHPTFHPNSFGPLAIHDPNGQMTTNTNVPPKSTPAISNRSTRPRTSTNNYPRTSTNNSRSNDAASTAPMFGTKEALPNKKIAGQRIVKNFSLFIGGVDINMDEQALGDHIVEDFGVEPIDISINKTNRYNRSFKVDVKLEDKDSLLVPEKWENNIIIKPFKLKRNPTNHDQQNQQNQPQRRRQQRDGFNQNWRYTINEPFQSRWNSNNSNTNNTASHRGQQYDFEGLNTTNPWL